MARDVLKIPTAFSASASAAPESDEVRVLVSAQEEAGAREVLQDEDPLAKGWDTLKHHSTRKSTHSHMSTEYAFSSFVKSYELVNKYGGT